jgi:glycosyltransferase involved in cell wall biosynthesis
MILYFIDDNSKDDSKAIIQRDTAADSLIRSVLFSKNLSMPINANFAVAQSDRPYITLLQHGSPCWFDLLEK